MTIFIGDVHGKYSAYKKILKREKDTIQIGDMGVGFIDSSTGKYISNPPYNRMLESNARFIRGNHDNPNVCRRHSQWIEDGYFDGETMFIGGALSIDRDYRIEGCSWWPDEELSLQELDDLVDKYVEVRPRRMVTHDCPEHLAEGLLGAFARYKLEFPSRTRQAFESMYHFHRPEVWVFGHWHQSLDYFDGSTRFVCLNELEVKEID